MSQIYKNMNKSGKTYFWLGLSFQTVGMIAVLFGDLATRVPILGACMLAVGISQLITAQFDERCNIMNNSKGEPLDTMKLDSHRSESNSNV